MKKLCGLVLALLMIFGMVGCSGENPTASQDSTPTSDTTADTSIIESSADESSTDDLVSNNTSQTLVVYFSCTGNTKEAAEEISQQINADIFEIVPEVPYTTEDLNYNNDNCRAIQEMNDDSARPAISSQIEDLENYDTVFIGYPIWSGTMPKIINTLLDTYDFSGKTIIPFCTSGGSGIGTSVSDIKAVEPDANVLDGLRIRNTSEIAEWLEEVLPE